MPITVDTPAELLSMAGTDLGHSSWIEVTQDDIDMFADATKDHQWIHVDPERASSGPFGTTIAHGYLTLALIIPLWSELLTVEKASMGINYGLNKVRFPAPVPVGSRLRLSGSLASIEAIDGGVQLTADLVMEIEGGSKPVCAAQAVYRIYE
ncbi:MAG TPA: MaoC family dehydratase [Acidimicrobiia bacterium]|nr:MaoC family dehydratase [Acidimicrobiia bacterium]